MKKLKLLTYALLCLGIGTTKAQYTDLLNFVGSNGAGPNGGVILSGSTLYGLTSAGGLHGDGCIFSISTTGTGYTDLHNFDGTDGNSPQANPLLYEGNLYGTTYLGGAHNDGNIFSISTSGTGYTDLFDFNGTNGSEPFCTLIIASGGVLTDALYGMTYTGGANSVGNVFAMPTSLGSYTDLLNFNTSNGSSPTSGLILSSAGNYFYGMTEYGGVHGYGCIFTISTSGTGYVDLFDFNSTNGKYPNGELTLSASGTTLYGMTYSGGANNEGCVFSISTSGTGYTDLLDFNGTNGKYPYGSLSISGNVLYGMASAGGANSDGVVFAISTTGSGYTDLLDFNGTNTPYGQFPTGNLTLSNDVLYGMTFDGGTSNTGTVFSLSICDLGVSTSVVNASCASSSNGSATATTTYGISPYTYLWSGEKTTQTITGLTVGTYTITVSDNHGCTATTTAIVGGPPALHATAAVSGLCTGLTGEPVTVTATGGTTPYTYLWEPGGGVSQTESEFSGTYTITVTDHCGSSTTTSITVTCAKGPEAYHNNNQEETTQLANIAFYPNPNNGQFTIAGLASGMVIETYDYMGRLIRTITANSETMQINLANQTNGIYLIRVLATDGTLVKQTKMMKVQ